MTEKPEITTQIPPRRRRRLLVLVQLLTACENFDMDNLDVFGLNAENKPPGARKLLFSEGVPDPAGHSRGRVTPDNTGA